MHRGALLAVLGISAGLGLLFGWVPALDVAISRWFFDEATGTFPLARSESLEFLRRVNSILFAGALIGASAFFVVRAVHKATLAARASSARAIAFLLGTAALGPGLLVNLLLKEHWARPRPGSILEFNARDGQPFVAWWDISGQCDGNCSFVAGEASIAFWTLAIAALVMNRNRRWIAYAAACVLGVAAGLMRVAAGGHFFSDVVFAAATVFVVVFAINGVLYGRALRRARASLRAVVARVRRVGVPVRPGVAPAVNVTASGGRAARPLRLATAAVAALVLACIAAGVYANTRLLVAPAGEDVEISAVRRPLSAEQ